MDTFTTVLSVFSTVCAIVFGYIAFVRNRDKDKESNVKHDATVLTEIGYIKANTDEIKAEQKEQRKTNTEFVTRLTDVEASAKQAHKRLDHIISIHPPREGWDSKDAQNEPSSYEPLRQKRIRRSAFGKAKTLFL